MERLGNVVTRDEDGKIALDFGVNKRKYRKPKLTHEERESKRA